MVRNKRFGELVGVFRQRVGVSQSELARLAGIDASHLNRIERGLRGSPRRKTVEALCRALLLDESERNELLVSAGYVPEQPRLSAGTFGAPPVEGAPTSGREKKQNRNRFVEEVIQVVRKALSDERIPEYQRRALAKQLRSFVEWIASECHEKLCHDKHEATQGGRPVYE